MTKPQIDIRRIVDDVLAELKQPVPPGDLVLTCRVVTMSEVAGRLEAIRRLVVPVRAVVTPAVRDELRRKNIGLAYARAAKTQSPGAVRLILAVVGAFDAAPLVEALSSEGIGVEPRTLDCLIAATDQLAVELGRPNTLGVLLTQHTAVAICLANRQRGVRTASGADAAAVAAAAGAVGANLLVLDPAGAGLFPLKQMITEFWRGGIRACPEVFRERLD